jgi:WD40 repeat protein
LKSIFFGNFRGDDMMNAGRSRASQKWRARRIWVTAMSMAIVYYCAGKNALHAEDQNQLQLIANRAHSGALFDLDISRDGKLAVSAADSSIGLWDVNSGRLIRTINVGWYVYSVALSSDSQQIWSGGVDNLKIFDSRSGRLLSEAGAKDVKSISFSADGSSVITASGDGIHIWDAKSGHKLKRVAAGEYRSARFSRSENEIIVIKREQRPAKADPVSGPISSEAIARDVSTLLRLDRETGKWQFAVPLSPLATRAVPSPNDDVIATSDINAVSLWDAHSGKLITKLPNTAAANVAFSPHGEILVTSDSKALTAWDPKSGQNLRSVSRSDDSMLTPLAFSSIGRLLLSSDSNAGLRLWNWDTFEEVRRLGSRVGSATVLGFEKTTGNVVMRISGVLRAWDLRTGDFNAKFAGTASDAYGAAVYYQGRLRLVGMTDRMELALFDVDSGSLVQKLAGQYTNYVVGDHGNSLVAVDRQGINEKAINIIDLATGKPRQRLVQKGQRIQYPMTLAHSPVGKRLLSLEERGTLVKLRDTSDGHLIRTYKLSRNDSPWRPSSPLRFSKDGTRFLVARANEVAVFDVDTDTHLGLISVPSILAAEFMPNSEVVIVETADAGLQLWEVSSGKLLNAHTFGGQTGPLSSITVPHGSIAVSDNGARAASVGADGSVHLWDLRNGRYVAQAWGFDTGGWMIRDNLGHFDSNRLEEIKGVSWFVQDSPLSVFPPEIFMRDYFEPRLVPRLLVCQEAEAERVNSCAQAFKQVRPLTELNRVQPEVKIKGVRAGASPDMALVDVEVAEKEDPSQKNGKTRTAVYDLRLFRAGQLVGQWPEPKGGVEGRGILRSGERVPRC